MLKAQALAKLKTYGQSHVLEAWDTLASDEQNQLLSQVETIDWAHLASLYQSLVVQKRSPVRLPTADWEPATPSAIPPETARSAGLKVLTDTTRSLYGSIVVAGGTGSGLKFAHPKGLFPATPLSQTPLYHSLIEKFKAAAHAYGHRHMFPAIFMVSDETEHETREYFEKNNYFGEPDRILFVKQSLIPLLDRRPGREGRVVMRSKSQIAMGGAGHGDAFDHVLTRDSRATAWLQNLGVRYLHFFNVDNLLNPFGDPEFLGAHVLSEGDAVPGRAHISLILIPKKVTRRMGNVIQYRDNGRLLQQSIDYGILPEVDARCSLGHASLQIVTLTSLEGTASAPFMVAEKEIQSGSQWIPVWKFERSSNNKDRYGALLQRESDDVFASIKKRNGEASFETPDTAARLQSEHWKKHLDRFNHARDASSEIPPSTQVELPWDAEYMDAAEGAAQLNQIGFPRLLQPDTGYWIVPGFQSYREAPLRPPDPDRYRIRAIVAEFNNHFEEEPDLIVKAPGRNTVIGDHQDYPPLPQDGSAQSFTIAWASQKNILLAGKRRSDQAIKLWAVNYKRLFTFSLDDLEGLAQEATQNNLPDIYGQELYPWAMNVLALLFSARHGRQGVRTGLPLHGAELAFEGNIPMGGGQSSSAAYLVAVTLACNDLFNWNIPRSDIFTLADIARSGEHEDYSPFVKGVRSGYLDQMTCLSAVSGKAVVLNHGNYRDIQHVDLSRVEEQGYCNVIVSSGLSRSLGETEYSRRVDELTRLPAVLNRLLTRLDPRWKRKTHIHQFTPQEWRRVAATLDQEDPTLGRRARYVFEENERTAAFRDALEKKDMPRLLASVQGSGEAMSMRGPYQISGYNETPKDHQRIAALDLLRDVVLRHAGPDAAARMIGGGGAGPLYLLIPRKTFENTALVKEIVREWQEKTGLTARIAIDPPAGGAEVLWRRPPFRIVADTGTHCIQCYTDYEGQTVYRLVDQRVGMTVEVVPYRGTVRALSATINGEPKAILYNPEIKATENGAAPYIGPWINRIKNGLATFGGHKLDLLQVKGVRDDGFGHALHGLMTRGWHVDDRQTRIDEEGISLVSWIEPEDYSDDPGVHRLFGPARTRLTHRLKGNRLYIESTVVHHGRSGHSQRIPVLAAVHPWFLLDSKKHPYVELALPARKRRITWKQLRPRLQMIPIPFLPAVPIRSDSPHDFRQGRHLGTQGYDDNYTGLEPAEGAPFPVVVLREWFRDVLIKMGIVRGFDELTLFRPDSGANTVCIEPQISSINALGSGAPIDAHVPTLGPGESYSTRLFIEIATLSKSGIVSPYLAKTSSRAGDPTSPHFPILLSAGMDRGPLVKPEITGTHKDAVRIYFAGKWHIYGTGHEMRDPKNPPPGHRPHRGSILFHLVSSAVTGPYCEETPPLLLGGFPKGIYEAPSVVVEGDTLHLFAQTTYYRLGGSIEHFTSTDGHHFVWQGTALRSLPGTAQAGVYDVDAAEILIQGQRRKVLVYSGFSREGGREDRPDPQIFVALSRGDWSGPFENAEVPILRDRDVPWHNSHDPANPYYEWGLEGAQLLPLPNGRFLLLCVAFEKRPSREYMAAQRLLFALYDERLHLLEVSNPILPLTPPWEEYGHGSMMIDPQNPARLRLLYQARPGNEDKTFRDSNSWRLFEALFEIAHLVKP